MFRDWTEATIFRPGMVPVPIPVLSLARRAVCLYFIVFACVIMTLFWKPHNDRLVSLVGPLNTAGGIYSVSVLAGLSANCVSHSNVLV